MSRTVILALAVFALAAVSGCDDMASRAVAQQGPSALKESDAGVEGKGDCVTCAKFRTRPPSGINIPPSL